MGDYLQYADIVVGEDFGPIEQIFSEDLIRRYCVDWADQNPLYRETSPYGYRLAPITYDSGRLGADLLGTKFNIGRTIVTKTAQTNLRPVALGQAVRTTGRVEEKYVKRGYEYVVVSYTSRDETGQPFRTGIDHLAISLERRAES